MGWLLFFAIVGACGWMAWRVFRAAGADAAPGVEGGVGPRIRGDGAFAYDVVGESHYTKVFERLLGKAAYTEETRACDALLSLEDSNPHDSNAVAISIQGYKVGYLSRSDAKDFRAALKRDALGHIRQVSAGAKVYCGGEDGLFSVRLDLPRA